MKKLTLALLILALLLCGIWTVAAAETENTGGDELHAALQHVTDSPVWVTNLPAAQDENTRQLFIVAGMGMDKTTASVSMHQRGEDGSWQQILSTPAYVGRNGLCLDADHAEGCGQTPIGVYRFNRAFGIAADPGCAIPYFQVDDNTYWSGDPDRFYNQMVDIREVPDLFVNMNEEIASLIIEQRNQPLQDAELVMCNDEPGVLHINPLLLIQRRICPVKWPRRPP